MNIKNEETDCEDILGRVSERLLVRLYERGVEKR